ncbi:MAG: hypothetical protein IPK03_00150 [Bacteroidetes bacterium]|nr:hypothetical protein [Bacteroidota bacterium]MBP7476960.1 hypothetical protein [Chitinophagales bacterium]
MAGFQDKWDYFIAKLSHRHRFVVLDDETYEEKASFLLSRLNVILALSTIAAVNIALTSLVIIYTPLKQYIPGYGDYGMRMQIRTLIKENEKLNSKVNTNERWVNNVKMVLNGEIPADKMYVRPAEIDDKVKQGSENTKKLKNRN